MGVSWGNMGHLTGMMKQPLELRFPDSIQSHTILIYNSSLPIELGCACCCPVSMIELLTLI